MSQMPNFELAPAIHATSSFLKDTAVGYLMHGNAVAIVILSFINECYLYPPKGRECFFRMHKINNIFMEIAFTINIRYEIN